MTHLAVVTIFAQWDQRFEISSVSFVALEFTQVPSIVGPLHRATYPVFQEGKESLPEVMLTQKMKDFSAPGSSYA